MGGKTNLKTSLIMTVLLVGMGLTNICKSDGLYTVVDDMEDYNDRDDIREVWTDGYANVIWGGIYPFLYLVQGGSSGSNLNVSTAVGSPYQGSTAPIHSGDQAMVLHYDNDGWAYKGLPGEERWIYDAPYYSEIEANTVGINSLNVGQNWAAEGFKWLSLSFQGHPVSDGYYDATAWPAYTLYGRGRDISGRHDEFYFLSQYPFIGNGSVQVQVLSVDNTDPQAKAGVMIREKWTPYSKYAAVFITPGHGVSFQWRENEDGPCTDVTKPGVSAPQYVRLVRNISGAFEAKHSDNGSIWYDVNAPNTEPVFPEIAMGTIDDPNIYVGTAVTSHNALETCTADFYNVQVSPLPPNWVFGNIGTNDPEQLYVALSDGNNTAVVYHPNPNTATLTSWQEWNIPLTAFTGVDLNSVKKVHIGSGDRDNPTHGGSGTVYIDDIRLSIDIFDGSLDLGRPGEDPLHPGAAAYDGSKYTVTGGGSDWWHEGEYARFLYKLIEGDFRIETNVAWQGDPDAGNEWKKAGVAIRNDINRWAGNEKEVNFTTAVTRPNVNRGLFMWRLDPETEMGSTTWSGTQPTKVAIQRCTDPKGDSFVEGFVDRGSGWERIDGKWALNLNDPVYVGLFVTSHDNSTTETAEFTNVQFVEPVCPAEFPRKAGAAVWDPERTAPVAGGWGILEVVDNGTMNSIADAITSLESTTGTRVSHNLMGPINVCDSDPQTDAKNFGGDGPYGIVAYGIKPAGTVDDLAALARGQVMIPHTDYWSFYINSDDGDELSVDNGALVIGSEYWKTDSFGTVYLTAGPHNIQVLHRERSGDADVEVAAARGATTDLADFRLIGSGEPGEPEGISIVPGLANMLDPHDNIWIEQSKPGESGQLWNLSDAVSAWNSSQSNQTSTRISDTLVNHSDPDNRGDGNVTFGGDCNFPYDVVNGPGSDDNYFAVKAMGEIRIDTPGTYYIGYNSDDGARLIISGQNWLGIVEDETGTATIIGDTMQTDGMVGRSWTVGRIDLPAGNHYFELLMFDIDRGSFVELFGGSVPGVYGLLKKGPQRMVLNKPAVADALELVHQEPVCLEPIPGDHNNNCKIDFYDIAITCSHWLECNLVPVSDCR